MTSCHRSVFLDVNQTVIIQCAKGLVCTSYAIVGADSAGRSGPENPYQR